MDETQVEQALAVEKIYNEVVEDTLQLKGQEPIKIWLRPLGYPIEKAQTLSANMETYKLLKASGMEDEDANFGGYTALRMKTLYFVIRKGPEPKAPRLLQNERQLAGISYEEQERLLVKWYDTFEISEEELGNSLRVKTNS